MIDFNIADCYYAVCFVKFNFLLNNPIKVSIMFNLKFNSLSDVNDFAGIVGTEGLINAYNCPTLDTSTRQMIADAVARTKQTRFCVKSFNDGDSIYEVYVSIDPSDVTSSTYHDTRGIHLMLSEVTEDNSVEASAILDTLQLYYDVQRELSNLVGITL